MSHEVAGARVRAAWPPLFTTLATFLLLVLSVACLYWARPVLIPIAVAVLLTFMLGPAVTALQRRHVPRTLAVVVVVIAAGLLLGGAAWLVGSQLVQLLAELPAYQDNVARRITEVRERGSGELLRNVQRFVHEITVAATQPSASAPSTADTDGTVPVRVVERAAISSIATWAHSFQPMAEPIFTTGLVIVLVAYLLIFREDLRDRIVSVVGRGHLTVTTKALNDAGRRISRYLLAQFGLNAAFGLAIGLGLLVIGIPHALLWGFTAGVLRYIPYVGAWIACSLPVTMSLLVSDGWLQPLEVMGLFLVIEFIANLVIEPWLYGQSIGVSQAAWMIAIIFWTWLWGAVGLMLATPLTTCLVILGRYVPALKFFDTLLGDEPALTPDVSLYQRLLARDIDEAAEIVTAQSRTLSPVELCDRVLVPALVHARGDRQADLLSPDEYEFVLGSIRQIADQHELGIATVTDDDALLGRKGSRSPLTVLACAAQDGAETAALDLFQRVLDRRQFQLEGVLTNRLVSEIVELVADHQAAIVVVAALPSGGLAHTRHLCKRLKRRFPQLKIIVGRWGAGAKLDNHDAWIDAGADKIATTFAESIEQLTELAQFLRPAPSRGAAVA